MSDRTEDLELAAAIARDLRERERVEKLTNEQLVEEILTVMPFTANDALFEEACTRLDPKWMERGEAAELTPADEAMLARCMGRFNKKLEETRGGK